MSNTERSRFKINELIKSKQPSNNLQLHVNKQQHKQKTTTQKRTVEQTSTQNSKSKQPTPAPSNKKRSSPKPAKRPWKKGSRVHLQTQIHHQLPDQQEPKPSDVETTFLKYFKSIKLQLKIQYTSTKLNILKPALNQKQQCSWGFQQCYNLKIKLMQFNSVWEGGTQIHGPRVLVYSHTTKQSPSTS